MIGFVDHPKACEWEPWSGPLITSTHPWSISDAYGTASFSIYENSMLMFSQTSVDYMHGSSLGLLPAGITFPLISGSTLRDMRFRLKAVDLVATGAGDATLSLYRSIGGIVAQYHFHLIDTEESLYYERSVEGYDHVHCFDIGSDRWNKEGEWNDLSTFGFPSDTTGLIMVAIHINPYNVTPMFVSGKIDFIDFTRV